MREDDEDRADDMPAGRNLRLAYKVNPDLLAGLKRIVQETKQSREALSRDPEEIYHRIEKELSESTLAEPEAPTESEPGMFSMPWEKRVFVGGSYKEIAILGEIKDTVRAQGYEPVLARDFKFPEGLIHHHSLMLLHECKYAVFDLSQEAGQLMEIERLRDYDVEGLIVYQSVPGEEPKITEMLRTLLKSEKMEPRPYENMSQLHHYITDFLPKSTP